MTRTSGPAVATPAAGAASSGSRPPIATVGVGVAPSRLSTRLASHADARRALTIARDTFIRGERIDMGWLAVTLGVDRTSVFRWVGNRDELLTEVLWSLAVPTLVQAELATERLAGAERVAGLLTHFAGDLITADYFRAFLRREPARALRLLTTADSPIQRRFLATAEWLVRRELGGAPFGGAIGPGELAYLLVRVSESFTYADLITGDEPSVDRARTAFRHLLRVT